jgi:UDP-N-acetylmuramoylalanine--D-glutamate ligase
MLELHGKRVAIVGLGISGLAAAKLAKSRGAHVVLNDSRPKSAFDSSVLAGLAPTRAVFGGHDLDLADSDVVVVSPGVPSFPALVAAEQRGVHVVGEVDFALQCLRNAPTLIAIGGTNGKSTVTSLLGAMAESLGRESVPGFANVFVGGNLGEPLAAHADETFDTVILEVSSFQMERVTSFQPRVNLLLNITDDHLDRYSDFAAYANAKGNAFMRQTSSDCAIVPEGDAVTLKQAKRGTARLVTFGLESGVVQVRANEVVHTQLGIAIQRKDIPLQGAHNALNVAAALAAMGDLNIPTDPVVSAIRSFEGLAHRMSFVARIGSVSFYDDSKGTNVGATVTAIQGLAEARAVVILGGKDKGGSYGPLAETLRTRGRAAVLIGEAAPLIEAALQGAVPTVRAATMDLAVAASLDLAKPNDAVLLSPACSSFDMFRDYKHRGDVFVAAVKSLQAKA